MKNWEQYFGVQEENIYGSEVIEISKKLINYLVSKRESIGALSFGMVNSILKNEHESKDVIRATLFLCSNRKPLLQTKLAFWDDDEGLIDLTQEAISELRKNGKAYNPKTGDLLESEDNIVLYFVPYPKTA